MKVPVVMPQLGLTMTEGSVNTWLMKLGDTVHTGDMLFVVSTDKADMEIEAKGVVQRYKKGRDKIVNLNEQAKGEK